MNGFAYVFLRANGAPLPLGCAGHVGWGFLESSGRLYAGSIENESGRPIVMPGGDNGWWAAEFSSLDAMLDAVRQRQYTFYKVAPIPNCNPPAARTLADAAKNWGYCALGNNCLDNVVRVLHAYAEAGVPWDETHPSPNDWFAAFNGEVHNL